MKTKDQIPQTTLENGTKAKGNIWKDVNLEENADFLIGKYICGFSPKGKRICNIIGYDAAKEEMTYDVLMSCDEQTQVGTQMVWVTNDYAEPFVATIEPQMLFYAFDELEDLKAVEIS